MAAQVRRIAMISTHGYVSANPEFGLPDTGGQVVYVLELSKCFARMGYQVDILTRQFLNQPSREKVAEGIELHRFPCGGNDFIPKETLCEHIPEWVENAARWLRSKRRKYEFINSHYWDAGLAGQALANQFDTPHLHTPHSLGAWKRDTMDGDPAILEQKYNFAHRIREERTVYDECNVVIATTPQQQQILSEPDGDYAVSPAKLAIVPPGYDDTRFFPVSPATREAIKHELNLSGPLVMAIGRLARNKGYDLLIQAFAVVAKRVENARLLLAVGSTHPSAWEIEERARLEAQAASLGLAERVIFGDHVPDDKMASMYRAADVFALSSRYEPFGMTAVEAMACGTPCVITTEGGLQELVTWGLEAISANPFDCEEFGHALTNVLRYPRLAAQLARHGSFRARAKFTWNGIAQQILRVTEGVEDERLSSVGSSMNEVEPWMQKAFS